MSVPETLTLPNIVLLGKPSTGKSTAARFLVERWGYTPLLCEGLKVDYEHVGEPYVADACASTVEAQQLAEEGFIFIRIDSEQWRRFDRGDSKLPASPVPELDEWQPDYIIENNGSVEELEAQVLRVLNRELRR